MTRDVIEEWQSEDGQYRAEIVPDYDAQNPRTEWDHTAEIVTWSYARQGIGDRGMTAGEEAALQYGGWAGLARHLTRAGAVYIAPISGISHSGISIWIARAPNETSPSDSAGWDSGQWGFILVTRAALLAAGHTSEAIEAGVFENAEIRLGYGKVTIPVPLAEAIARAEVREYDSYLTGEVYAYVITRRHAEADCPDPFGCAHAEIVDSCAGFIGDLEYVRAEARAAMAAHSGQTGEVRA